MSLMLEVVFGVGLFAVALLMVFGIFPTSHRATTSSKNLAIANDLAREFMEGELSQGYDAMGSAAPVDVPVPVTINGVDTTTVFQVAVEVFTEAAGAAPDNFERKRVVVTVTWREGTGADRTVLLETYAIE